MSKKLNSAECYESLGTIKLSKEKTPIAYENKVQELMNECGVSREEAEQITNDIEFELEIYYEQGSGLFAVESEAVESGTIYSPYTREEYTDVELNEGY